MESRKRADSRRGVRTLVILIILIAAGAAAYYFYTKNKDDVDRFVQKTEKELGEKIKQNAGETKKSIEQGIPSNSKYKADREGMVK